MLNYLWGFMIIIGVIYGAFTGNVQAVADGAIECAKDAITLCITMLGVMSLWTGLMEIAEKSGLIMTCTKKIRPVMHWMFPDVPCEHESMKHMTTNVIANILGLGWAATPAGLRAMESLAELNGCSKKASDTMCAFLVINVSSLQLIPVNIIAYRSMYGSSNPTSIVAPSILATTVSTLVAVIFCRIMTFRQETFRRKRRFCMNVVVAVSGYIIPAVMLFIVIHGMIKKVNVYDEFVTGAKDGMKTVVSIAPTLVGLMMAVGVLRASGFLDMISGFIGKFTGKIGLPSPVIPLLIVRMFSSSAATGLTLDLFKEYGTDSLIGLIASIASSATETIFFTISVYSVAAKITKTRWTLSGALISTLAGIVSSVILAMLMI